MNKLIKRFRQGGQTSPDGMYVWMPDYNVSTGIPAKKLARAKLGHGMAIAVDRETGVTRGSEYGRYDKGNRGIARRVSVPDTHFAVPGNPTQEELDAYADALKRSYGHTSGTVKLVYYKDADANKMKKLMQSAESNDRDTGYYVNTDYRVPDHNYGTYAASLIRNSLPWLKFSGLGWLGTPGMVGGVASMLYPTGVSGRNK